MSVQNALPVPPSFGGRLQADAYYSQISQVIGTLRNVASLNTIAAHLNAQSLTTPTGLPFNRERVRAFLRQSK